MPLKRKKLLTSDDFQVESYCGSFGVIQVFRRIICQDCNRIRLTANGVFNVRNFIR